MARKLKGYGHGGRRPGSGRPKGSRTRRDMLGVILPRLTEEDRQLPMFRLLDRMRDDSLDPQYRDLLACWLMPYLHPRPRSDRVAKAPYEMSTAELAEVVEAEMTYRAQVALGRPPLRLVRK